MVETEGPQMTSQHGAYALHAGLARLHARMCMHTSTSSRTHAHARTHTYTHKYVILIALPREQWLRERASVMWYTYVACLVSRTNDNGVSLYKSINDHTEGFLFRGRAESSFFRTRVTCVCTFFFTHLHSYSVSSLVSLLKDRIKAEE
jgi:hypothetical protein